MESHVLVKRFRQLQSQRKSLDNKLQDINRYVTPGRNEYFDDMHTMHSVDLDRVELEDTTAVTGAKLLSARIHSNLASSVTRWFNIRFRDDELNTLPAAKEWLEDTVNRVWQMMQESNINNSLGELFKDIVTIGTSIFMQEPEDDLEWKGIKYNALPIMDSYFEMGPDEVPYRVYRRIRYTRLELEERFPDMPDDISIDDAEESSVDAKIEVLFAVYKRNDNTVDDILTPEDRPYAYKYILLNSAVDLEEGGYYEFPGMVARWDKMAGTMWGTSPCLDLLPTIKQLNTLVSLTKEARAKAIDPPYITTERGIIGDLDSQPGGITVVTDMDDLRPMLPASDFAQADQEREYMQRYIWTSLFLDQMELKESPAMTATEVAERTERTMRLMSATAGRVQTEVLDNIIQFAVNAMLRQGQLLELPESVQGQDLDFVYTGPIPRAQKAEIANGIIQWLMEIAQLAELFPEMLDIPDTDQATRTLAELRGVPADLTKTEDEVEEVRNARAEQQQQMQEAQNIQMGGEAMKAAGEGAQAAQAAGLEAVQ